MNWLKFSILSVLATAVWYALFAFVIWEPDTGAWTGGTRLFIAYLFIMTIPLVAMISHGE